MKNINEHCIICEMTDLTDELKSSDIIHVQDHMPLPADPRLSIKGQPCYSKNTIIDLFNNAGVDYKDRTFVFDTYLSFEDFPKAVFTGEVLYGTAKKFKQYNMSWKDIPTAPITKNFSFMIGRARAHRKFLATVVKNLIPHNNYSYTMVQADGFPIEELLIDTDYNIDVNNSLPYHNVHIPADTRQRYGLLNFRPLYDAIFARSPISLITEPMFFERGAGCTEKLFMSIYSGQFMIWPGTYKAEETVKRYGIDTFSDIIDHSYQYIEHPGKRVVEAIKRNYKLLTDLEYAQQLHQTHFSRLQHNFKYVQDLNLVMGNILANNPSEWHKYIINVNTIPR
jgi:hypothetical protein